MKVMNILVATTALSSGFAQAQMENMQMGPKTAASSSAASTKLTDGEIRKIDMSTRMLTLQHGPIENLGMPAMTMAFKVTEPNSLSKFKEGDKVRFRAERMKGAVLVTRIEAAR